MSESAIMKLSKADAKRLLGDSSGLILDEHKDGITIGYVDFDVSEFGGRDYECFYKLDAKNAMALKTALAERRTGTLFNMCAEEFTIKFSNSLFESFCLEYDISYTKSTY